MQSIRNFILHHVRLRGSSQPIFLIQGGNMLKGGLSQLICTSTSTSHDQIMDRVIKLVKKFDKIDSHKVIPILPSLSLSICFLHTSSVYFSFINCEHQNALFTG